MHVTALLLTGMKLPICAPLVIFHIIEYESDEPLAKYPLLKNSKAFTSDVCPVNDLTRLFVVMSHILKSKKK